MRVGIAAFLRLLEISTTTETSSQSSTYYHYPRLLHFPNTTTAELGAWASKSPVGVPTPPPDVPHVSTSDATSWPTEDTTVPWTRSAPPALHISQDEGDGPSSDPIHAPDGSGSRQGKARTTPPTSSAKLLTMSTAIPSTIPPVSTDAPTASSIYTNPSTSHTEHVSLVTLTESLNLDSSAHSLLSETHDEPAGSSSTAEGLPVSSPPSSASPWVSIPTPPSQQETTDPEAGLIPIQVGLQTSRSSMTSLMALRTSPPLLTMARPTSTDTISQAHSASGLPTTTDRRPRPAIVSQEEDGISRFEVSRASEHKSNTISAKTIAASQDHLALDLSTTLQRLPMPSDTDQGDYEVIQVSKVVSDTIATIDTATSQNLFVYGPSSTSDRLPKLAVVNQGDGVSSTAETVSDTTSLTSDGDTAATTAPGLTPTSAVSGSSTTSNVNPTTLTRTYIPGGGGSSDYSHTSTASMQNDGPVNDALDYGGDQTPPARQGATAGIIVGAAGAAIVLGISIFILARRYIHQSPIYRQVGSADSSQGSLDIRCAGLRGAEAAGSSSAPDIRWLGSETSPILQRMSPRNQNLYLPTRVSRNKTTTELKI